MSGLLFMTKNNDNSPIRNQNNLSNPGSAGLNLQEKIICRSVHY
jgi:hypothetical protein